MAKKNIGSAGSYYTDLLYSAFRPYDFQDKSKNIARYCINMLNKTTTMFEYKNLPENIPQRILERYLQINGKTLFFKHEGEYYVSFGNWGGLPDPYYEPTIYIVNNPYIPLNKEFKIGEDSVLIRNDSCMYGLAPTFRAYASMLAENDLSIRIADINTRLLSIVTAPDDNTKASVDELLKKLEDGSLSAVTVYDILGNSAQTMPYASGSNLAVSMTSLIELQQYIKASWLNDIGLNANYNMKRESLNSGETGLNEDPLLPTPADMLNCRKIAIQQINDMFGLNIEVELSSAWKKHETMAEAVVEDLSGEGELVDSVDNDVSAETDILPSTLFPEGESDGLSQTTPFTSDSSDGEETVSEESAADDTVTEEPVEETSDIEDVKEIVESIEEKIDELSDQIEEISEEVTSDE